MTQTVAQALRDNRYPGRGIVVGLTPDGRHMALAYFLTGRSENSRNRVLVEEQGKILTRPVDPGKVTDPSLIIYPALRVVGVSTVLSNGAQTDTIAEALDGEGLQPEFALEEGLQGWAFEPDEPNFTSRISAVADCWGLYRIAQLRERSGTVLMAMWKYVAIPGEGHMIHTYSGNGDPLPPFTGEPVNVATTDDQDAWTAEVWAALDAENRISLMTRFVPVCDDNGHYNPPTRPAVTRIINRYDAGVPRARVPGVKIRPTPKRSVGFRLPEDVVQLIDLAVAHEAAQGRALREGEAVATALRETYGHLARAE